MKEVAAVVQERWSTNQGLKLHWLEGNKELDSSRSALVYIPGSLGTAEHFRGEMERLAPRHCVAISLRGCGPSDAPEQGYTVADHVTDIEAVVADSGLGRFCLMAFSMGVNHAVAYAAKHPERVRALVIVDYPPAIRPIPDEHVQRVIAEWPGAAERHHVMRGHQRDLGGIDQWHLLEQIACPTLIFRGGLSKALTAEQLARYQAIWPHAEVVVFEESGHAVWDPDWERFMRTVEQFLEAQDKGD